MLPSPQALSVHPHKERFEKEQNPAICGALFGALGRTRTCGLLIRSQPFRQTLRPGGARQSLFNEPFVPNSPFRSPQNPLNPNG
jgi:hypothetical protein